MDIRYIQTRNYIEYNFNDELFVLMRIPKNKNFTGIKQLYWKNFGVDCCSFYKELNLDLIIDKGVIYFPSFILYRGLMKRYHENPNYGILRLTEHLKKIIESFLTL